MSFSRSKTRIKIGPALVKMAAAGSSVVDVGYLVEGSLFLQKDPVTAADENGNEHEVAAEIGVEFEMLQGSWDDITTLDGLVGGLIDIEMHEYDTTEVWEFLSVPFSFKMKQTFSYNDVRTITVNIETKAKKLTDKLLHGVGI